MRPTSVLLVAACYAPSAGFLNVHADGTRPDFAVVWTGSTAADLPATMNCGDWGQTFYAGGGSCNSPGAVYCLEE